MQHRHRQHHGHYHHRSRAPGRSALRPARLAAIRAALLAALLLALLAASACGNGDGGSGGATSTPLPTPTPTAQPVVGLYRFFNAEKERNPVRFERIMEDKDRYGFYGVVSKIDGTKVQFHIAKRRMRRDEYVECRFEDKDDLLSFSVGDRITLYGRIADTGRIVKFEECRRQ